MTGKVVLTAVVALASAGFLLMLGNKQHYKKVDELGELARWTGKEMMVHGNVVPGSIKEEVIEQDTQRTFLLEHGGKRIRVFNAGPKPDTFKDSSEVVAIGAIVPSRDKHAVANTLGIKLETSDYVVDASELRAKCPTRYIGVQANRNLKQPLEP